MTIRRIALLFALAVPVAAVAAAAPPAAPRTPEAPAAPRAPDPLKTMALETLMAAPPERAVPILARVLGGDGDVQLKRRALFVLAQVGSPEADALLLDAAREGPDALRTEAIRALGIRGDGDAIAALEDLLGSGDARIDGAVLQAFMIAGHTDGILALAEATDDPALFGRAVDTLAALGAKDALRTLGDRPEAVDRLIPAYAVAGDADTLLAIARDADDPARRARAVQALGIAGGNVGPALLAIHADTDEPMVRDAVRRALMISGDDETLLVLYRRSTDAEERRALLRQLVHMDSNVAWDLVDEALANED